MLISTAILIRRIPENFIVMLDVGFKATFVGMDHPTRYYHTFCQELNSFEKGRYHSFCFPAPWKRRL